MKAIIADGVGGPEVLRWADAPSLPLGALDLRIAVVATSVNRADLLQRRGLYPPPPGASPILGLECSGIVSEVGSEVRGWHIGDQAMALLAGGGYAEEVVVDSRQVLGVPPLLNLEEAGGFMETFLTADHNLFGLGGLQAGETALVHGGSGGVGTSAIQLLHEAGITHFVTAGSDERCRRCAALGAALAINYQTQDFVEEIRGVTGGKGTSAILDPIGGVTLERNLSILTDGGRLVVIGLQGGSQGRLDLARLVTRRLRVIGSVLRSQSSQMKAEIIQDFKRRFRFALDQGRLRPVVDRSFPLAHASLAHRFLESGAAFGKVLLTI